MTEEKNQRGSIPPGVRFSVFDRDVFRCRYCGRSSDDVVLHVDHLIPISRGGTDEIENLVTACAECNQGKGARLLGSGTSAEQHSISAQETARRLCHIEAALLEKIEARKTFAGLMIDYVYESFSILLAKDDRLIRTLVVWLDEYGEDLVLRLVHTAGLEALNASSSRRELFERQLYHHRDRHTAFPLPPFSKMLRDA